MNKDPKNGQMWPNISQILNQAGGVLKRGTYPLIEHRVMYMLRTSRLLADHVRDVLFVFQTDVIQQPEAVAGAARVFAGDRTPRAYVCVGETCAPPTTSPAEVATLVRDYGRVGPK